MNAQTLADTLNGTEYPLRLDISLIKSALEAGLVIVHGGSDDLVLFEGAICEELGAWNGKQILINKTGVLGSRDDLDTDEQIEQWLADKKSSKLIEALWAQGDYSWHYRTNIPHIAFDVVEGDDKYCKGMIIRTEDLPSTCKTP